jgi:hypothetical protein
MYFFVRRFLDLRRLIERKKYNKDKKMKLVLRRRFLGDEYTVGSLYLSPDPSPQGRGEDSAGATMSESVSTVSTTGKGEDSAGVMIKESVSTTGRVEDSAGATMSESVSTTGKGEDSAGAMIKESVSTTGRVEDSAGATMMESVSTTGKVEDSAGATMMESVSTTGKGEDSAGAMIKESVSTAGRVEDSAGATMRESVSTTTNVMEEITTLSAPIPTRGAAGERNEFEYFCDTLEDKDRGLTQDMPLDEIRRIKVTHETAIPTGVYRVIVNISPSKRRMLPRLLDVPGFSGILIHRGNTKNDSSGCILVGENKVKGKVINSTQYEKRLVEILTEVQDKGEEIFIRVMSD